MAAATTSLLVGCGLFGDGATGGDGCLSTEEYFAETAWPQVLGESCIDCHSPGGPAQQKLAKFRLLPAGYPGFLNENLNHTAQFAETEYQGESVLLLKALGGLNHGGGPVLKDGSEEHLALQTLVEMVREGNSCGEEEVVVTSDDVALLDAAGTFRKATLHLAYRLPSAEESERLAAEGESALPDLIEGLFEEEAFYERIKDLFNDHLLTDQYLAYTGYSVNQLNEDMYPESGDAWDLETDDERRAAISRAIAREPLEFIAHLIRANRPFTTSSRVTTPS